MRACYRLICLIVINSMVHSLSATAQELQSGWIYPNLKVLKLPTSKIAYLPEEGLILYDKPDGEMIAKLSRDLRNRNYPNYQLNILLQPRNRTPELLHTEALKPLPNGCYAIPFVNRSKNHILLFSDKGPYYYWVNIDDLKRQNFFLTDKANATAIQTIGEDAAGLLIPDFEKQPELPRQNYAYAPTKGVNLYREPGGAVAATLSRFCPTGRFSDGAMRMFILPIDNPNNCQFITTTNLHHLSDDTFVIPYVKHSDDYILLFTDPVNQYWARGDEFLSQNFRIVEWKTYFIERRQTPSHANSPGLILRASPYADAAKILEVKGEEMDITITGFDEGFCEGPWCKVKVKTYKENPCTTKLSADENNGPEYEGWIMIVDDNGQPNVYINTKGC